MEDEFDKTFEDDDVDVTGEELFADDMELFTAERGEFKFMGDVILLTVTLELSLDLAVALLVVTRPLAFLLFTWLLVFVVEFRFSLDNCCVVVLCEELFKELLSNRMLELFGMLDVDVEFEFEFR